MMFFKSLIRGGDIAIFRFWPLVLGVVSARAHGHIFSQ